MDEAVIDDLKQFILATVSQAFANAPTREEMNARFDEIATKIEVNARFDKVDKRFDDLELKLDTIADAHAERLDEHNKAIKNLQQQAA